ncbi:MAG: hypothetical protein ACRDE2_09225 [Chitinophagaceae bacterium]
MRKSNYREKILLDYLPNGSEEKKLLVEKIRKYRNECGCSMGGKFLAASMVAGAFYLVVGGAGKQGSIIWNGLICLLFIFICAGLGKLTGIGIAKLRLSILLNSAYKKLLNR